MKKWGIGIEHEMRVRFKNSIKDLSKEIYSNYFYNSKNDYIFIESTILLYYFKLYEVIVMKDWINNSNIYSDTDYTKLIKKKYELINLAKKKIPYPISEIEYFDKNKIEESFKLIHYYIMIYSLFHAPLIFFRYNFNYEMTMDSNKLMNLNNIKSNLDINNIEKSLVNLYNGKIENQAYDNLKKLFDKKNIDKYEIHYNDTSLTQEVIFYYGDDNISLNDFIKNIDIPIKNIREIFKLEKIDFYNIGHDKFYKNLYDMYSNNIPHIDSTFQTFAIEFKTIHYENISYEKALEDLIQTEKTFFYLINHLPIFKKARDAFGEFIYHNIGSVKKTLCINDIFDFSYYFIEEDYTGSYHIWITLPYNSNISTEQNMKKFINNHVCLANKLQLLEPILAAHYTSPSYNALNNNESNSSLRQFLNSYSNYGTSDVTLMYGVKKHTVEYYYLSENDILEDKKFYPLQNKFSNLPIFNSNGKNIINYSKLNTRIVTNNIYNLIEEGNNESNSDIYLQNYYSMIFEKTKIRTKRSDEFNRNIFPLGSDIRTRNLNEYIYPLNKEWERCLLLKKNKLIEVYYNRKLKKISYDRIYDKADYKKNMSNRVGIEFRIFDHFPTKYLDQILAILPPIVIDSLNNDKKILFKNTFVAQQFWHNEMFNVITKGYKYIADIKYLNAIEKEFKIKFKNKKNLNSSLILKELYEEMNKNHKGILYNKIKFNSPIHFTNINKKAWLEIIENFFENRPELLEKILYLDRNSTNNDILNIIGEKYNYKLNKIKNYLENIKK